MSKPKGHPSNKSLKRILRSKSLKHDMQRHIISTLGNDYWPRRKDTYFKGVAYSVRDRLIERWIKTQRAYYEATSKRVYYLSMEFLPGRFLMNNIINMQLEKECEEMLEEFDFDLQDLEEEEWDAGLGNGGLGRLASCFMDSMATLKIPAYGYGIHYDYGIFFQTIVNGYQVERCDNWLRQGSPWEIKRPGYLYEVRYYGRAEGYKDDDGKLRRRWVDTENLMAMACDVFIPGYGNENVNNMRLWSAVSSREFNLEEFNVGDYMGAMESKVISENISKVLYPSDEVEKNKELRLKQQYFFVCATFQDIMRRFKKKQVPFSDFPDLVAVHLNDTHPSIGIPELMRLLMDDEKLGWDEAWDICMRTFAYTNHTILPEALETWPVALLSKVLPRHMEIIFEINRRFLEEVERRFPGDVEMQARLSLIKEGGEKRVRMAHLAIVGSHKVNGVAELHTRILKNSIFKEFDAFFPDRIINITNGVTPRRWLLQANPNLSRLISSVLGKGWISDLRKLKKLAPLSKDSAFREACQEVKKVNKNHLAKYILRRTGMKIDPASMFDVQAKRIHEYKRQLLNVLHVITRYNRIKDNPAVSMVPRTVIFAGKAAPGYARAKLIIKLINSVADVVNNDPEIRGLKVVFLPNYCVSQAEKLVPAADLSQQISMAGMEASGTGNMKFALNDALTIGTLDGANIEIMEAVGRDNIFIFGLNAKEVVDLKASGYRPHQIYESDPELKQAIDQMYSGHFSPDNSRLFAPICDELLGRDKYMVMADYRPYLEAQAKVDQLYNNPHEWTRRSILNSANMGRFSSDRAVLEYASKVWNVRPLNDDSKS